MVAKRYDKDRLGPHNLAVQVLKIMPPSQEGDIKLTLAKLA